MHDANFDLPVTVETERTGRFFTVTRVEQAARMLAERWPAEHRGPKYRAAIQAMMDALEQRSTVEVARRAFVEAAKEAHVFVREGMFDAG